MGVKRERECERMEEKERVEERERGRKRDKRARGRVEGVRKSVSEETGTAREEWGKEIEKRVNELPPRQTLFHPRKSPFLQGFRQVVGIHWLQSENHWAEEHNVSQLITCACDATVNFIR